MIYVLVAATHGIVGEEDSAARAFETHDAAHAAMEWDVDSYIAEHHADDDGFNAFDDVFIDGDHACVDEAEWHIYETELEYS